MLRPLSLESGGQGEKHVHLHGLYPDGHEDDLGFVRGASRSGGHGTGDQSCGQQEERTGNSLALGSIL